MRKIEDTYILKHLQPVKELDEEKNPANMIKPGFSDYSVEQRRMEWTRRLGIPLNVLAVCENPVTNNELLESMLHDWFGPWRVRCTDNSGMCSRETSSNVPFGVQALGLCFAANATAQEVDPVDFTKFSPRKKFQNWVMNKIHKFNQLVHAEGVTRLNYGRQETRNEYVDGPYVSPQPKKNWYANNSKLAHEVVIKFNKKDMPKSYDICKYKQTTFAVS